MSLDEDERGPMYTRMYINGWDIPDESLAYFTYTKTEAVFINAVDFTIYSPLSIGESDCELACDADVACEMYLMADTDKCKLCSGISGITYFETSGTGHAWWGKVKVNNYWADKGY
jgi:hypothetical protein